MIHHLSIPAKNPLHVAEVIAELFGGWVMQFGPYRDSYIAWAGDEFGSAIEVYPVGTELQVVGKPTSGITIKPPRS